MGPSGRPVAADDVICPMCGDHIFATRLVRFSWVCQTCLHFVPPSVPCAGEGGVWLSVIVDGLAPDTTGLVLPIWGASTCGSVC